MSHQRFGNITVVKGENGGRFPFCNTLFIDDAIKVIIDPGAGLTALSEIKRSVNIDKVINTHYHFDHIAYNYLFDNADIFINEIEAPCFRDRSEIPRRLGLNDVYGDSWTEGWLKRIKVPGTPDSPYSPQNRHEWWLSTARLHGTYKWGDIIDFGHTKMRIVAAPGHSAGFCCPYFPEFGVVYTGDIDLTAFGPWYFGADGDIGSFVDSALSLLKLDADTFITGHEEGILSRPAFIAKLEKFLEVIEKREKSILSVLSPSLNVREVAAMGLIYGKKFHIDDWVRAWEIIAVQKHVQRINNQQ